MSSSGSNGRAFPVDRGYVEVSGPGAEDFLERMLSNEVATLSEGETRRALLLTPKGRIIASLRVVRTGSESFLLVTDASELAEPTASSLRAARFASRCEIDVLSLEGLVVLGREPDLPGFRTSDFGVEAFETWREAGGDSGAAEPGELEELRIQAGTPAWGKEIGESILPAEAGLDETHISFSKGCFPGQEPIARLHYRGHANRRLRRLEVGDATPGDEIVWNDKVVGRVTSAVPGRALGYVRTEVPEGGVVLIGGSEARLH
jgi:folate-binding protein YgfZ